MGIISCDREAERFNCTFSFEPRAGSDYIRVILSGPKNYRAVQIGKRGQSMDRVKESLLLNFLIKFGMGHFYGSDNKKHVELLFKNMEAKSGSYRR